MNIKYLAILFCSIILFSILLHATADDDPSDPEEIYAPEITIINRSTERIEEYRMGGHLYMIKITPHAGTAYYFIDTDGDGNLESSATGLASNLWVPMWLLFKW